MQLPIEVPLKALALSVPTALGDQRQERGRMLSAKSNDILINMEGQAKLGS